jgi:hypothetical protein
VQQHVCIAVADRFSMVGNGQAAQDQRPTLNQPMRVVPDANAKAVRGAASPIPNLNI